jgi:hypothetical protein
MRWKKLATFLGERPITVMLMQIKATDMGPLWVAWLNAGVGWEPQEICLVL